MIFKETYGYRGSLWAPLLPEASTDTSASCYARFGFLLEYVGIPAQKWDLRWFEHSRVSNVPRVSCSQTRWFSLNSDGSWLPIFGNWGSMTQCHGVFVSLWKYHWLDNAFCEKRALMMITCYVILQCSASTYMSLSELWTIVTGSVPCKMSWSIIIFPLR